MEQKITAAIDAALPQQTAFLRELVKIPSDNPPGDCAPHGERAATLLEEVDFTVARHPVPADAVRAAGMISATNLIVRERFGDGPVVALNAHGDVVPPGEGWSVDPYGAVIRDGALYGRGVAVSKSDFATYAFALKALKESGAPLAGTIELHLTYDEEAGGTIGPKWLLDQGLSKPDYAISAGFSYAVVTAHNGCLHLEVDVRGRQAHAAMPDTGADALEAATTILNALYDYRNTLNTRHSATPGIDSPTMVVGLIEGGINTNVVPDRVRFRLDRRLIPEENGTTAEAEITAIIGRAAAGLPGIEVRTRRIMLAEPFAPVGDAPRLAEIFCDRASTIMGEPVTTRGVPLYTDARHYSAAGVATVLYGAGPHSILDANAHGADEHLQLDDLNKATKVVALSLLDLLG